MERNGIGFLGESIQERVMNIGESILELTEGMKPPKAMSADEMELYSRDPKSNEAAKAINDGISQAAKGIIAFCAKAAKSGLFDPEYSSKSREALGKEMGRQYKKHVYPVMKKYSDQGATDTEPRYHVRQALIDMVKSWYWDDPGEWTDLGDYVEGVSKTGELDESMPGWKPLSSEKSKLKGAFDQVRKDLKTATFEKDELRSDADSNVKSAWQGVMNPGWGAVLGDLENAMESEIDGRGLTRREDTIVWELYLVVMEVLTGLTERLARKDGSYFVYIDMKDKLDEMRQKGRSQTDIDDSYFNIEYPWTEKFDQKQMSRLFKAAQGGFVGGLGMANDALLKLQKDIK